MTDDRMALVELIEQGADSDLVREMLAFAAERMMDMESRRRPGFLPVLVVPPGSTTVTAIASVVGTPALAGLIWQSRSCARAVTSRVSWSHAGLPRKLWQR
jgi:hypothetical protein